MTDTQWADTSEFQVPVDGSYPYRWFAFRMCNGDGPDRLGQANYAWCQSAVERGALDGFFAYTVFYWDSNWAQNLIDEIGPNPHPNLVAMIDVESWQGYNSGDFSANLNAGVRLIAAHLGDINRVVGYGNAGDLNSLWPDKSALAPNHLIYANYSGNPGYPGAFAHQYTDAGPCAPFGSCDMNSADGYDSAALQKLLGIGGGVELASVAADTAPTNNPASSSWEDNMLTALWNGIVLTIGPEFIKHETNVPQASTIGYLLNRPDRVATGSQWVAIDDAAMNALQKSLALPWYAIDACLKGVAFNLDGTRGDGTGETGKVWSRVLEISAKLDGVKVDTTSLAKTIADVQATIATLPKVA